MNHGNNYIIDHNILKKCEPVPGPTVVTVPDGVRAILPNAFDNCVDITEMYFPESVTFIPIGVFFKCWDTTVIHLPDSIIIEKAGSFFGEGVEPVKLNLASFYQYTIAPAMKLKKVIAMELRELDRHMIPLDQWGNVTIEVPEYVMPKVDLATVSQGRIKQALVWGYLNNRELYENHEEYHKLLVNQHKAMLPRFFREDRVDAMEILATAKKITAKNVDELFLSPAREAGAEKIVAFLEDWKAQAAASKKKK